MDRGIIEEWTDDILANKHDHHPQERRIAKAIKQLRDETNRKDKRIKSLELGLGLLRTTITQLRARLKIADETLAERDNRIMELTR